MKDIFTTQIVELLPKFKTPRCKRGGDFSKYLVHKINKVNVVAINLGTFRLYTLRISQLRPTNPII